MELGKRGGKERKRKIKINMKRKENIYLNEINITIYTFNRSNIRNNVKYSVKNE